ncbi:MAG: MBG domain-containing protein [Prevotellaceae bacterium]|nr:MBG domain-containing protein [Prevotellaceae bacterium]
MKTILLSMAHAAARAKAKVRLLITAALVCGSLNAFADGTITFPFSGNVDMGSGYSLRGTEFIISSSGTYTITGNTITHTVVIEPNLSVNITFNNLKIQSTTACAFSIGSGTKVNLTLEGTNTLKSGGIYAGLQVPFGAELTIDGDGALDVTGGGFDGAGIGSEAGRGISGGHIIINGGTVTATGGGDNSAGIGGADSNSGGIITVNGGTVNATGKSGAGIGSGPFCYNYNGIVIINGGVVTAQSSGGAGIGGGAGGSGEITINGGVVKATSKHGAGIGNGASGSGSETNSGKVIINGGTVTAKSEGNGAGIGCGMNNAASSEITITGGVVDATSQYGSGIGSDFLGATSTVSITGGTVTASSSNNAGIGSNNSIFIDGGSVNASSTSPQPKNSIPESVYLTVLTLGEPPIDTAWVSAGEIDGVSCANAPNAANRVYGVNDVRTDDEGKLYFWLPKTETSQIISITAADTTYDNRFRRTDNTTADYLYRAPTTIVNVTSLSNGDVPYDGDTSGTVRITFSRPMPTGNTKDTVRLVCRECINTEIVLPQPEGRWIANRRSYEIPFSGLEYSSTYRVYAVGFCDTTGRKVEKDTAYTFSTTQMQTIGSATYQDEGPYTVGDTITANKGEYKERGGGSEGDHIYQWYRSDDSTQAGAPIDGASDTIYTPGPEDFGKWIHIETTPVGSEGHRVRPVPSEKIRIGVKLITRVAGGHGGTATPPDTVVYDTLTPVKVSVHKSFANDAIVSWTDSCASSSAGGKFTPGDDGAATYKAPAAPKGDITLTATLALSTPRLTFPTSSSITYGDTLKQAILTGGSCSCGSVSFAWEAPDTMLKAGTHSLVVVFTPTDHGIDYDYSKLEGWKSDTTVRRKVEVVVAKKDISIAGGIADKIYDGSTGTTVDSLWFDGLVAGDTLRLGIDYEVSSAEFDTPAAGSNTATIDAALTGSELASNYNLANGEDYPLANQTIHKAAPDSSRLSYTLEDTSYDGKPHPVEVEPKDGVEGLGEIIAVFYNGDTTPPVNAGEYIVSVKIGEGDNYNADSFALGVFIIHKVAPDSSLLNYTLKDTTYDGKPHPVEVEKLESVEGLGDIMAVFYNGDTTPPVNAGEYIVKVAIGDGSNYNNADSLLLGALIIRKASPDTSLLSYMPEDFVTTYDRTEKVINVAPKPGFEELGNITVLYDGNATPPINAGSYTVTVQIEESGSYSSTTLELGTLTINKAQLTADDLQFTPIRATYDETPHGVTVTPTFPCGKPCTDVGDITATYNGSKKQPVDTGRYVVEVTVTAGNNYESVTTPMELGIFQIRPATILYDTICQNEEYHKNGFELPAQKTSGIHVNTISISGKFYDSIVQLRLEVYEPIRFSDAKLSACADDTEVEVEYTLTGGAPSHYAVAFDKSQSVFANVENAPLPAVIHLPSNVRPDYYSATLRLSNDKCPVEEQPLSITISYPSFIMAQKWNNVIALRKGDYEFTAYQWLKNGEELPGATQPYLYMPPMLDPTATYSVLLTRTDGVTLSACPCRIYLRTQENEENITAYPTVTDKGSTLTITSLQQGEAIIRNTFGVGVTRQTFGVGTSTIAVPGQAGIYFIELCVEGEKAKTVKILVK